jgi:hypothetical protein
MPLQAVLYSVFDLLWIAVFILIIRRGFLDRTFGLPFAAVLVNLAWDTISSFVYPVPVPQVYFEMVFAVLDVIILFQLLKFWRTEFSSLTPALFYGAVGLGLITAAVFCLVISNEFRDFGNVYAGFGGNFMGSVLFVVMLLQRGNVRGQSIYIALAKWLGTASASLAVILYPPPGFASSVLLPTLCLGMFVYDFIYVVLIYRQCRAQNIAPWTRW